LTTLGLAREPRRRTQDGSPRGATGPAGTAIARWPRAHPSPRRRRGGAGGAMRLRAAVSPGESDTSRVKSLPRMGPQLGGWPHPRNGVRMDHVPSRYRLRVKEQLGIVAYAVANGIKPASRRFGLEQKTIRRGCWPEAGSVAGLVPRYPARRASRFAPELIRLIAQPRRELEYGRASRSGGFISGRLSRSNPASVPDLGFPRLPRAGGGSAACAS
jgi:hypothetical protein